MSVKFEEKENRIRKFNKNRRHVLFSVNE